jgi:hypothetical protein
VRFWKSDQRRVPSRAVDKIRHLAQLAPAGAIIRNSVRQVLPNVHPWAAHRIAVRALSALTEIGLVSDGAANE